MDTIIDIEMQPHGALTTSCSTPHRSSTGEPRTGGSTNELVLNISDKDYIAVCGKDSDDKIILELKHKLCVSPRNDSVDSRDPRESLKIGNKSISNKSFIEWKRDEAYDNTTRLVEIRATRLNVEERSIVCDAIDQARNPEHFVLLIKGVKGVFLLDQPLLVSCIAKFGEKIYEIIDQLGYNYHLLHLSETIYHELYARNESMPKYLAAIDGQKCCLWTSTILSSFIMIFGIVAVCLLYVYLPQN